MVISWNIEDNVKSILRSWNIFEDDFHIEFGEDCFNIVISDSRGEIFSDMVDELKDCFNNDVILIRVDGGNIVLGCDIVEGTLALYQVLPSLHKN